MRRISIVFVLVTLIATISVATTMTMVQADPTGDEIKIIIAGIPASPQEVTSIVSPDSPEYVGFVLGIPLFVDVVDGMIWVDLPVGLSEPFSVHIEDLDWLDESGNEIPGRIAQVHCELFIEGQPVGPSEADWGEDVIWIFVEPFEIPPGVPFSIHCEYFVEHDEPQTGSIHGMKWNDLNGDGIKDDGELGISGWIIDIECDGLFTTIQTDDDGNYWLEDIPAPNECTVFEEQRPDWQPTTPPAVPVFVEPGERVEGVNFGNWQPVGSIHGMKWNDLNGDGIKDDGELGIPGWRIDITCDNFNAATETDLEGNYWFEDIPAPNECIVAEEIRPDWEPTTPDILGVNVEPGERVEGVNFGNQLKVIQVEIDIKPGSDPSSVNCKANKKGDINGVVPVAILSDVTFDAGTIDIEILSMSLVGSSPIIVTEVHGELHLFDVDGDGLLDSVLHLDKAGVCEATKDTPLKESVDVELSGETTDGTQFVGTGDIRIVKR